jgi:hypothetical protein
VTTYTYDPSGTTSATGSANDWPFQYQGMEKEFTDPSTYYYTGGGQFYSPQLSRSLSEVGETSSSQGACPLVMLSARILAVRASVLAFRAASEPNLKLRARVRLGELL